jgi:hypothetical protein
MAMMPSARQPSSMQPGPSICKFPHVPWVVFPALTCQKKYLSFLTDYHRQEDYEVVSRNILKRIQNRGKGSVFTARDFLDLGSRAAVDQTLARLARKGTIRRIAHGLYDYPRVHQRMGQLSPQVDLVAKAVAKKAAMAKKADRAPLQIAGAQAANVLGLSPQVPAQRVYLTDGPPRTVQVLGRQFVHLRYASPRNLIGAGTTVGTVFQALRYLGRGGVDDAVIRRLRVSLSPSDKDALRQHSTRMPDWMRPVVDQITQAA